MTGKQGGFTLIELMIVVAIIGVLSAIAVPQYQSYVARSEAGAALATLRSIQTAYEEVVARGETPNFTADSAGYLGMADDAPSNGTLEVIDSQGGLRFTFADSSGAFSSSDTITLSRSDNGAWECLTGIEANLRPAGCDSSDDGGGGDTTTTTQG